jgi:hypothetical protein
MLARLKPFVTRVVLGGSVVLATATTVSAQDRSYESLNVCERVPIAEIAKALSGRALDAKPVNVKGFVAARCVYGIEIAGARQAFVVWVNPVGDFEELRSASEPPVANVTGVGDDAFATTDKETKRTQLTARARGKVTVQVTSARLEWAQAAAKVVLSKF